MRVLAGASGGGLLPPRSWEVEGATYDAALRAAVALLPHGWKVIAVTVERGVEPLPI